MDSPLIRVFISHASPDGKIARCLAQDLRAVGNHVIVDLDDLRIGDDVIQFMNDAINDTDYILILYSQHTLEATNQPEEVNAAIWSEINQSGAVCMVVRLDETQLPPMLGRKVFCEIEPENDESYSQALAQIVRRVSEGDHPTSTVAMTFSVDGGNPFRRTRAEYFEDEKGLLTRTFAPPDQSRLNKLEDIAPCILEGPRGTGKSMLLMSLRARNYLQEHGGHGGAKMFGCYLKLTRGSLTNVTELLGKADSTEAMLKETSSQELFICILESMLSEVRYCIDNDMLHYSENDREVLCRELGELLGVSLSSQRLGNILDSLNSLRREIARYIRRKFVYGETAGIPTVAFDARLIGDVIATLQGHIRQLNDHCFVILLDEYENLHGFQQEIVNGLAKEAAPRFSVKIARKHSSGYPSSTPSGQEWQETHDYSRINLVYDLSDRGQRKAYKSMLQRFVTNIIREELGQSIEIDGLLPTFDTPEIDEGLRLDAVVDLCKVSREEFNNWPESKQQEKVTYYGTAATYRCLQGGKKKRYAGWDELAFVSSGVIRYFQEMLAVGYYLRADGNNFNDAPLEIAPEHQNRAVHVVSAHNLTSLSRNVDGKGEALRFFLLDLGGCLRHKLLKHSSEPEAARISLKDPERLTAEGMGDLRTLLDAGVREGVFEKRDGIPGYRPRHIDEAQAVEFLICRIFAPVLSISPRARWRTETTCAELRQLVDRDGRLEAVRSIRSRWVKETDYRQERLI